MSASLIDCPRCAGSGMELIHPPGVPFSQSLADMIECTACRGTGFVEPHPQPRDAKLPRRLRSDRVER